MKKLFLLFAFLFFHSSFCNAQYTLWGMTLKGGKYDVGVIFKYDPINNILTKKFDFTIDNMGTDTITGNHPEGSLLLAPNGKLYGMTVSGGEWETGVVFEYNLSNENFNKLLTFDAIGTTYGKWPYGSFIQATNGKLYGMPSSGGNYSSGIILEYDIQNNIFTKRIDINDQTIGYGSFGDLVQASNGKMYGLEYGNASYNGSLFEYDEPSNTCTKLINFYGVSNGAKPVGSLIQANNDKLYGLTQEGGVYNYGVLFEYDISSGLCTKKVDFDSIAIGSYPSGTLLQASNGKLYGMTPRGGLNNCGTLFEYDITIDTIINKFDFDGINGCYSYGTLTEAPNGMLYGMTTLGGLDNLGVIFEYDPTNGSFNKKFDFDSINGKQPAFTKLILVPDSIVNVSELSSENKSINIYPNPSDGEFYLEFNNDNFNAMTISDIQGRIIYSENNLKELNHISLNIKPGLYIIKIRSDKGCMQKKLIIE